MADPFVTGPMAFATILSAGSSIMQGNSANASARFNADQESMAGQQAFAGSQREAWQNRRQGDLVLSRAKAVAAASGAGAGAADPTAVKLESDIAAQGEYDAMTSLFNGLQAERTGEIKASLDRYEGRQAKIAGQISAASDLIGAAGKPWANTLLSGGSSLFSRFGAGGFQPDDGYSDLPRYG